MIMKKKTYLFILILLSLSTWTSALNLTTEYRSKTASWTGTVASTSFRVPANPIGSGITSTYEGSFFTIYLTDLEIKTVHVYYEDWVNAGSPTSLLITTSKYDTEIFIPEYPNQSGGSGGNAGGGGRFQLNILEP